MEEDYMLTTFDNKFNPFTNFVAWWKEDLRLGHDCCGLLARTANTSDIASDEVNEKYIDEAADYIIAMEPTIYKKVYASDYTRQT
jgi:hypothetical protein